LLKKVAALTLASILLCSGAAGCSQNGDVKVRPARQGQIKIGFSQVGESSRWRAANTKSIRTSADIENAKLTLEVAGVNQAEQIADIEAFISDRVDVIAFSPVVEDGWDDVLRRAKSAGIPVILTDRTIKTADESLYASSIGSNFTAEGSSAAVWVKSEFRNTRGTVKIAQLEGTPGSAPAVQRGKGFEDVIRTDPRLKIVASKVANFSRADGERVMKELLRTHDGIQVVFAQNDDMGLGAVAAIEAAGKRPGKDIKIVTIDAIKDGMIALSQRKINFIVECNPLIGPQLMDLVKDVYLGIPVPKRVDTEETVFFPESVNEYTKERDY
jgi:galactofuranose transport system substrate-binding protein